MESLKDKNVLILGATGGIGAASARLIKAIERSAQYGKQLKLSEVYLVYFYDFVLPKERLEKYETQVLDVSTGVLVKPVFLYLDR